MLHLHYSSWVCVFVFNNKKVNIFDSCEGLFTVKLISLSLKELHLPLHLTPSFSQQESCQWINWEKKKEVTYFTYFLVNLKVRSCFTSYLKKVIFIHNSHYLKCVTLNAPVFFFFFFFANLLLHNPMYKTCISSHLQISKIKISGCSHLQF